MKFISYDALRNSLRVLYPLTKVRLGRLAKLLNVLKRDILTETVPFNRIFLLFNITPLKVKEIAQLEPPPPPPTPLPKSY